MLILVDSKRSNRQPVALLKRADMTIEIVRMRSMVGTVPERRTRNAMLRAKAGARRARQADPHVREGEGVCSHAFLKSANGCSINFIFFP